MTFTSDLFFSYLDVSKFGGKKGTSDESPATPNGDAGSTSGKKRRRGKGDASPASSGPSSKKKKKGEEDVVDGEGAAVEYSEEAVSLHIRKLTLVLEMLQPRVAAMPKNESLVPHLFKVLKFFVQDKPATTTDNGEYLPPPLSLSPVLTHTPFLLFTSVVDDDYIKQLIVKLLSTITTGLLNNKQVANSLESVYNAELIIQTMRGTLLVVVVGAVSTCVHVASLSTQVVHTLAFTMPSISFLLQWASCGEDRYCSGSCRSSPSWVHPPCDKMTTTPSVSYNRYNLAPISSPPSPVFFT